MAWLPYQGATQNFLSLGPLRKFEGGDLKPFFTAMAKI